MNVSSLFRTSLISAALVTLLLASPSFAQQAVAPGVQQAPAVSRTAPPVLQPAPAVSQPAPAMPQPQAIPAPPVAQVPAPAAAVPAAPAPAASDVPAAPADGAAARALKSTTVALRELSPWSMFLSADVLVKAVMIGLAFADRKSVV